MFLPLPSHVCFLQNTCSRESGVLFTVSCFGFSIVTRVLSDSAKTTESPFPQCPPPRTDVRLFFFLTMTRMAPIALASVFCTYNFIFVGCCSCACSFVRPVLGIFFLLYCSIVLALVLALVLVLVFVLGRGRRGIANIRHITGGVACRRKGSGAQSHGVLQVRM